MKFYLGTHKACWLARTDVPLFVSRRTLAPMRTLPRAVGAWALDSGAFTEISTHGRWLLDARRYVAEVRRFRDEIGGLEWAAVMDWMCEPFILEKTGLSVAEHQLRSTQSYLTLKSLAPEVHWVPVLQGWEFDDYLRHLDQYDKALPFPLSSFRLVGLGSVCRRQGTKAVDGLIRVLHGAGLKLHGFGFKLTGLEKSACRLASSDSMAWSYDARRRPPLPGHTHKSCANCMEYALRWRLRALEAAGLSRPDPQPLLF
jgi:hypothetical protein